MNGTHLAGLEGTNPLGFLAALGAQVAFATEPDQPRLWWSDDITPHAVVDIDFTIDRIADQALRSFALWKKSPAMNPTRSDGSVMAQGDELKFTPRDLRAYLGQTRLCCPSGALATSLVAEGSLTIRGKPPKRDVAKPSDLYFTAGNQRFLAIAREILNEVSRKDVTEGLEGPWNYRSHNIPSLMWDVSDDRVYALRAKDPSKENKLTNPGPEALAILGLSRHPVFASHERTLTQGCSGSWKTGHYSWPLWRRPASLNAVKSLLANAYDTDRQSWFRSWGISRVLRSPIRRSEQGGYGTFGAPEVVWQAS